MLICSDLLSFLEKTPILAREKSNRQWGRYWIPPGSIIICSHPLIHQIEWHLPVLPSSTILRWNCVAILKIFSQTVTLIIINHFQNLECEDVNIWVFANGICPAAESGGFANCEKKDTIVVEDTFAIRKMRIAIGHDSNRSKSFQAIPFPVYVDYKMPANLNRFHNTRLFVSMKWLKSIYY